MDHRITFADVPFVVDQAQVVRMDQKRSPVAPPAETSFPRKHQPLASLIDEVDRLITFRYLEDFARLDSYPGRNLGGVALRQQASRYPSTEVKVGEWHYPHGASRWSVFRGLTTSAMMRAMLTATQGANPAVFTMRVNPVSPNNPSSDATTPQNDNYTLQTLMYMLPPRDLAQFAGSLDGLHLITLVDERWYWQFGSVTLHPNRDSTWGSLVGEVAAALGVTFTGLNPGLAYATPEPDSPLWANMENAALLWDAIAANVGQTVVRLMNGEYRMLTSLESQRLVLVNRGRAFVPPAGFPVSQTDLANAPAGNVSNVVRIAGGDIFNQGGQRLPGGDLTLSLNSILPQSVSITFPKYVLGDDPVPHFVNSRYQNQRPSAWYEDSYGDVYSVDVPLLSGGLQFPGGLQGFGSGFAVISGSAAGSGLVGVSGYSPTIHSTAKALFSGEIQATFRSVLLASGAVDPLYGVPMNASGLTAMAMRLAADCFNGQIAAALDEVYPGTFSWVPEGIHDIVWTWSASRRLGCTRVVRTTWNRVVNETQQSAPALSGYTNVPKGVGGPSVAQTWIGNPALRLSGAAVAQLAGDVASGQQFVLLNRLSYFPTQNRFRAVIGGNDPSPGASGSLPDLSGSARELVLLEATSGGVFSGGRVDAVYRGIDGTIDAWHGSGQYVTEVWPQPTYGVNLVGPGRMQWAYPVEWTSGGVAGVELVPQTQTVQVFSNSGVLLNGVPHFSGAVGVYDTSRLPPLSQEELCWVVERNGDRPKLFKRYAGQFVGHSAAYSGFTAPVYLVTEDVISSGFTGTKCVVTDVVCSTSGAASGKILLYKEAWTFLDGQLVGFTSGC